MDEKNVIYYLFDDLKLKCDWQRLKLQGCLKIHYYIQYVHRLDIAPSVVIKFFQANMRLQQSKQVKLNWSFF